MVLQFPRFMNKSTGKEVEVLFLEGDYVRVKYIVSGMKCWYKKGDFTRLFERIE